MQEVESTPLLSGQGWLEVIDNTEQGEELAAPLGLLPFVRGAVTTFGAETRVGKTVFGLQSYRSIIDSRHTAAYCTLEMSPALLFKRFWPQFGSEEACRQWILDNDARISHSYLDYAEVEAIIREGFDFVVIDHIHELPFEGHEDLSRKIKRIASLAPETNTAILMLSQMKQRDPQFDSGPPSIYDYSWTKAIPEVSAIAYAAWRPDPDSPSVEVVCLKNRFGPENPGVELRFNRQEITFERDSL